MRHLKPADYRSMPWKNGKGTTTEIAIHPPGSGVVGAPFMWRVSIADVPESGPFSRFPGYDRTIMMIDGDDGMWLDGAPDGPIELTKPLVPQCFSGDWEIAGRLIGGPLRDFNLMVERARAAGLMSVVREAGPLELAAPEGGHALLTVISGEVKLSTGAIIAAGETLLFQSRETLEGLVRTPQSGPVAVALIVISPLRPDQAPAS